MLLVCAALVAPLAGATFGLPHYLSDAMIVMPLLALFTAIGVLELVSRLRPRAHRTYQAGDTEPAG